MIDSVRAAAAPMRVPSISCPTIASADSPCRAISVVYTEAGVVESNPFHPTNSALVLVDSQVIMHSPVRTLIAGMGDALSTVFEARACIASGSPTRRQGLCTLATLAIAELRSKTGLADGVSALAAAHAVHNGLTVAPETHAFMHGEKAAFGVIVELMLENAPNASLNEALRFSNSIGPPTTLADMGCAGISSEMISQIAARATREGEPIHHEPFKVTAAMVELAIQSADAAGRDFRTK